RACYSLRGELECPGKDEGDWKPNYNQEHHQADAPSRNFKEGKNLGRNLNQQQSDHRIGDRYLVDVAPLQFGKERLLITHSFTAGEGNCTPSFWHKATKRGSSRYSKTKGVITSWVRPESWVA